MYNSFKIKHFFKGKWLQSYKEIKIHMNPYNSDLLSPPSIKTKS